jgi:thiamine biosynthesis lipoprotein
MDGMAAQAWSVVGMVFFSWIGLAQAAAQSLERFSFTEPHLGTIVNMTLYAPEEIVANQAAKAAFLRVKELDAIFSDYKTDSEMMKLCSQAGTGRRIKVSPELFLLLKKARKVSEQTDGAFDVSVGPLVQLWRKARKQKTLPHPDEITAARQRVGWKWISLDDSEQTVELTQTGMLLDFGGIAKGFIAQEVSRQLQKRGLSRSLVAVAGDIVAGDPPPDAEGWKIGVAPLDRPDGPPTRLLLLKQMAVSTSGDAFQYVEIGGTRYSHIVDPATGIGLTNRSSCTVVSRDGAMADALATAICVLGADRGMKLIEQTDETSALIVQVTKEGVDVTTSKSFSLHEITQH